MEASKNRYAEYYAKNKEAIAARRKARREALKAAGKSIPRKSRAKKIDESKIERYNALMNELESLKKDVAVHRRRENKREVLKHIAVGDNVKTYDVPCPVPCPE